MKAIAIIAFLLLAGSVSGFNFDATPVTSEIMSIKAVPYETPTPSAPKVVEEEIGSHRSGLSYSELMLVLNATRTFDFNTRTWGTRKPISEEKKAEIIQKWMVDRHQA